MTLFTGLLNSTCDIYRQTSTYDASTTEYGEIDESWELSSSDVVCRLDLGGEPISQLRGGLIEMGIRRLFIPYATDILKNDKVVYGSDWYLVEDVSDIEGYSSFHHKEAMVRLTDGVS